MSLNHVLSPDPKYQHILQLHIFVTLFSHSHHCLVVFSRSQCVVRFFLYSEAFLWPVVWCRIRKSLCLPTYMVRTQTNTHCYKNAGHHSYEWKNENCNSKCTHKLKKKKIYKIATKCTGRKNRRKKKDTNKLPYAVAVVLKSRHGQRHLALAFFSSVKTFRKTIAKLGSGTCRNKHKKILNFWRKFIFSNYLSSWHQLFLFRPKPNQWACVKQLVRWENQMFVKHSKVNNNLEQWHCG